MNENSALLIIDMQNVYLPGNEWECNRMEDTIKYIEDKIKKFSKERIFFSQHIAFENPKGTWKEYNEKYDKINSSKYINDFIDNFKKYITNENVFIKSGFSALSNDILFEKLDKFDTIYVTGVVAECCVLSTIFGLIDMGKKVIYCSAGIAGQNEEKENAVHEVLKELSPLHVMFE